MPNGLDGILLHSLVTKGMTREPWVRSFDGLAGHELTQLLWFLMIHTHT